jgi:hypothetical protein
VSGHTASLGNKLARLGRIRLGQAPIGPAAQHPAWLAQLLVEWSPTTGPMGAAVWEKLTDAVISFTCSRGRATETDKVEAGTLSMVLANDDRRFDPLNSQGPYYGQLVPRKRIRIQAAWNGTLYPVWYGYVEKWNPPLWRYEQVTCQVTASDGFGLLANKKISGDFVQQLTSDRISAVLDAAGWSTGQAWILGDAVYGVLGTTTIPAPLGAKQISMGQTTVQAQTLSNVTALAHIQLMATTEQGMAYVGPDGAVAFRNRSQRLYPSSVVATFGTDQNGGEVPYTDADIDATGQRIFNDVHITRIGGTEQTAIDQPSIDAYFGKTFSLTGLPLTTDAEALSYASFFLAHSKDFRVRLTSLQIEPEGSPDLLWPQALGRDLTEQIRVIYRPDVGSQMDELVLLEKITHTFTALPGSNKSAWTTTWLMSPANIDKVWILEDPIYGVLGTTTVPAY